jgi:hypothetical protein
VCSSLLPFLEIRDGIFRREHELRNPLKYLFCDCASDLTFSVKTTIYKEKAVSVLYIANAKKNDSGPYVCSLGNLTQNIVYVHVISGMAEVFLSKL